MRRTLIYFITIAAAFGCGAACAECIDEQNADAALPAIHGGMCGQKRAVIRMKMAGISM